MKCRSCLLFKDLSEFYLSNRSTCRKCIYKRKKDHQAIYYREWYKEKGRIRTKEDHQRVKAWIVRNPDKYKAELKLNYAVFKKRVFKPSECSRCNRKTRIHGHHPDYTKPLEVLWLCASCHKLQHAIDFSVKIVL